MTWVGCPGAEGGDAIVPPSLLDLWLQLAVHRQVEQQVRSEEPSEG